MMSSFKSIRVDEPLGITTVGQTTMSLVIVIIICNCVKSIFFYGCHIDTNI